MKRALARVFIISLHKYFTIEERQSFLQLTTLPTKVSLLTDEELRLTNHFVERSVNPRVGPLIHNRVNYNGYTAEERAAIDRYASENGATQAFVHFSMLLRKHVCIIPTAYASLVFDTSPLNSKSSPINGVHISLKYLMPANNAVNFVYFHCRMT